MLRRAPRKLSQRHPATPHPDAGNHCRAMVRVDGTAIRKKIKKGYEQARRDLDKARRALDQFNQTDQPQFTRWLNSHFGALITELRETHTKLTADDAIVFLVRNEVMFGGMSYARAYLRVMEIRANPEPPPPRPADGEEDWTRDPFGAETEGVDSDDEEDLLKGVFEEMFGEDKPGSGPWNQGDHRGGHQLKATVPPPASKRLKELYRAVVRRLHPDRQTEMTAQKTEWWHQAQAAYEAEDAEQLEVILTFCEIGEQGTTAHTSAALLQRITARLKSSLREIKRQIFQRRREPAWNFSKRTDHAVLAEQVRRELTAELLAMRRRWMDTRELIAKWKAAAEKLKSPRRRQRRAENPEFPF